MSDLQDIKRPDGKQCPAYVATPTGEAKGAIVVVQEWWGLNDQMKKTADRLAAEGFVALVPDLYRGKIASDADEASHCMDELDFMGATTQDILGCVQHLKTLAGKVAVSGFCMGGALTILSAVHLEEVDAGCCFYGIPPAEAADPATIKIPMQFHFANEDDWCTPDAVNGLEAKLKEANVDHELFRYDAKHGFVNDQRPQQYNADCAKQAWGRALAFFNANLSS